MAIKSENTNIKDGKPSYPYLGLFSRDEAHKIVLFTGKGTGVLVGGDNLTGDNIGNYSEYWSESLFVPFTGIVTLKNA